MTIRFAESVEYPQVLKLYKTCNYYGGVQDEDRILIAIDKEIIGAVRICAENNDKVLRGMQIKSEYRHRGIGSAMLKYLADNLDLKGCYCLPYKYLGPFYASIGFGVIPLQDAPIFLAERFEKYLSSGYNELIVMRISFTDQAFAFPLSN